MAVAMALFFVVTLAGDADARHRRPTARFSSAAFTSDFKAQAPDRFSCRFDDSPSVHGYVCKAGATTFLLSDALTRGDNPPPGEGFEGLATPDRFRCRWDGELNAEGERSAEHFICKYRHRDSPNGPQHTHIFRANEIVSVTDLPNPGDADPDGKDDLWLPPHPLTTPTPTPTSKPTATKSPTAKPSTETPASVPTAVPAGTDAAGGGPGEGLVGLVLATGGVVAGGAVIARRRFMHDS